MPKRPDIDEPTVTFYCEDCGQEFDVEGTLTWVGGGSDYEFEPGINQPSTVYCPSDDNDGDDSIHEVSITGGTA